ncbi:MAG: TIGR04551 family protein [Deltaproteobacteria bacterium]|nr:TIGR04551 family protein [Deltaproteobacteria bacterium]
MPYSTRGQSLRGVVIGLCLVTTGVAEAQISPGGGMNPGGMGGPAQPAGEEKKEGVAEAAPKTPGLLPTTPALPPPKGRRKRWKLIEIDGYFRLRTDWFKNFHLGFLDRARNGSDLGGAPFPRAMGCYTESADPPCKNLSSANMRLRLEPTINLDEGTSIHIQADVLDNLFLGSTPVNQRFGTYNDINLPPLGAFGNNNQDPPQAGVNSDRDSIVIKRAWAEVAIPLGILKFGRMPNHWGMGIFSNSGGHDPIAGTYDLDADYGDTVDRVSFSALIPGTDLRAMLAADWASTRLVSNQTAAGEGREGHPFDLDDTDDQDGWIGVISKMDSPQEFKDKVDRGDVSFNYGIYFEYKTQSWDNDLTGFSLGQNLNTVERFVPRDLKTYTPDLWAKLGYGRWQFEGEFVAQLGSINKLSDLGRTTGADIRKYGGALRVAWKGLEGKLRLGIEGGGASGDQWDNRPQGNTHISNANLLGTCATGDACPNDNKLSQFMFNREYKIDMILWRHLIGAVTNAGYVKPFLGYELSKSIGLRVANITSFALKPIATPGNSTMYGTEFNADISYSAGGLRIGLAYGVLFPFSAMGHPVDESTTNPVFNYGTDPDTMQSNTGSAGTAHTIQTHLSLTF